MNHYRVLGCLLVPALLLLNGCAATLPAPVVDKSVALRSASTAQRPAAISGVVARPPAEDAVVVSALAEPVAPAPSGLADRQAGSGAGGSVAGEAPRNLNPAVVSLINRANRDQQNGDHARAAANIERALKITPDDAWLWHRLAQARLQQGLAGQAAALAAKSNTLVGADSIPRNRELRAQNWLLIARVHQKRGEHVAAKAATDRARRIQSGAG